MGKGFIPDCLEALARLAGAEGRREVPTKWIVAARLCGAAESLREAVGAPRLPDDCADLEHQVAALRSSLGEEAFAAAWAVGRTMTLDEAVCVALEECEIPITDRKGS